MPKLVGGLELQLASSKSFDSGALRRRGGIDFWFGNLSFGFDLFRGSAHSSSPFEHRKRYRRRNLFSTFLSVPSEGMYTNRRNVYDTHPKHIPPSSPIFVKECCEGKIFSTRKTRVLAITPPHTLCLLNRSSWEREEIFFLFSRCVCLFIHTLREITRWPEEEEGGRNSTKFFRFLLCHSLNAEALDLTRYIISYFSITIHSGECVCLRIWKIGARLFVELTLKGNSSCRLVYMVFENGRGVPHAVHTI
jgi:hypothetical protein